MFDRQELEEIKQAQDKWEETTLQKTLSRAPERADKFMTTSSEPVVTMVMRDIEASSVGATVSVSML